ncbi:uncharacterized protein CXQ87_002905 [Candidozyma duobushaemuli]|uniref:Mitochondrial glycine transporter n=1 Tax=Candidozyma duobushaemuli TaxID=1231522 RepID=A0A2V1ACS5_9ASCO|nr:uncharacterized protein CXQ87_002905 [[Candida] duobushaemulonis]PVH15073.1 hypothetical protein CXQ87_002905 [[Candida] duobushaemulonis]
MSFLAEKHANYFRLCSKSMPAKAQSEDSNKLALIYFTVHGLALLGRLEQEIDREAAVADIYAYLIPSYDGEISGFRSSQTFALDEKNADYDLPNLSATFFALATLLAFEEDFSKKLDRDRIMRFVSRCQIKEGENKGSFRPVIDPEGQPWGESDLRLCYIAAGIRKMLGYDKLANRPFDIDVSSLEAFILDKVNFNGGLSSSSHTESHSGLTFCGIAALRLLGTDLLAPKHSEWVELTKQWLVHRQVDYPAGLYKGTSYEYYQECDIGGFNGRENKFADTCYSWWVVGSLNLLSEDGVGLINDQGLLDYLLDRTQHKLIGGFAKDTEAFPDPFHSFLAVCSVSLLKHSLHLSIEGSDVLEPVDGELQTPPAPKASLEAKVPTTTIHLISGGTAGLISAFTLQPLDLLKTRLQQQRRSNTGFQTSISKELKKLANIKDLWRGALPSTLRTSVGAGLYFTILSQTRTYLASLKQVSEKSSSSVLPKLSHAENLATGFVVRAAVGIITMPITIIKTRFESNLYNYNSMYEGFEGIYNEGEGPKGSFRNFFKGTAATLARDCPYAGLYVLFYESFKNDVMPQLIVPFKASIPDNYVASVTNSSSAVLAASVATSITAPFDAVKTRLQLIVSVGKPPTIWAATRQIVSEPGGARNLFNGLSLRLGRKGLSAGISWCIYEELLKFL